MKLVKGWAGDLPVRLLVEVAQGHGVGKQLVEVFGHFQANWLFKFQRQGVGDGAIRLDFSSFLMKVWLGSDPSIVSGNGFLRHRDSPLFFFSDLWDVPEGLL